jgi:hypothetical protein
MVACLPLKWRPPGPSPDRGPVARYLVFEDPFEVRCEVALIFPGEFYTAGFRLRKHDPKNLL